MHLLGNSVRYKLSFTDSGSLTFCIRTCHVKVSISDRLCLSKRPVATYKKIKKSSSERESKIKGIKGRVRSSASWFNVQLRYQQ